MTIGEVLVSTMSFLPFWVVFAFSALIVFLLGILVFKLVAFVMDVLPFV